MHRYSAVLTACLVAAVFTCAPLLSIAQAQHRTAETDSSHAHSHHGHEHPHTGHDHPHDVGPDRPEVDHGGILELSSRLTSVAGRSANFSGFRLHWVMTLDERHRTFVGGAAYVLTTREFDELLIPCPGDSLCFRVLRQGATVTAAYSGLDLRYAYRLNGLFEVGAGVVTGPGYAEIDSRFGDEDDTFISVEPELQATFRPTRYFGLTLSGSYRFVSGYELDALPADDFTALTITLGLQFGWV
jgi:hypothetical protein